MLIYTNHVHQAKQWENERQIMIESNAMMTHNHCCCEYKANNKNDMQRRREKEYITSRKKNRYRIKFSMR